MNGVNVSHLEPYFDMNPNNWFSQTIVFDANVLSRSSDPSANVLQIELEQGDIFVKDIVCFFKQNA